MEYKTNWCGWKNEGRQRVDQIDRINGRQLSVLPFGKEIVGLMKECYKEGDTIQSSTFKIVNELFGEYG
jgi:hypothetical protein